MYLWLFTLKLFWCPGPGQVWESLAILAHLPTWKCERSAPWGTPWLVGSRTVSNCSFLTVAYSLNPKMDCIGWHLDCGHFCSLKKPTRTILLEILGTEGVLFPSLSLDLAQCLPHSRYFIHIYGIIGYWEGNEKNASNSAQRTRV